VAGPGDVAGSKPEWYLERGMVGFRPITVVFWN
jgi:hypothetical protein